MDKKKAWKHYEELSKENLITLLISSRIEIENIKKYDNQYRIMKKLAKRIKKAIAFIDFYTCKRQYVTENDKELLRILEEGKSYYETNKT